ncbi:hypothetical protein [Nitrosopumilus ureiphilus]|uniref:Uncharacterized protein n=1 Tax=Nitrosopumilus ureiphilus TaxID=1470067 RepID=A0A7D5M4Q1_9ARCH|nr:hypothetical protein [Nitrosopumilus ureiphilus]QLH07174.1 hypothetical protein C5F50_08860 [Nitrosopumilus ureiphilus]
MKNKFLIIIGISLIITLSIFLMAFYIFDDNSTYKVLDIEMNVVGIKPIYEIGESVTFTVHVNSLGNTVPWPTLRIYQNYVDISSEPAYSRMYMTPIESVDKQKPLEWRKKTWNFPLDLDEPIRFFDKGNYTLRVDVDAKKHVLINFQVVNPTNESEIIDDFGETFDSPGNRHPAFLGFDIPEICTEDMIKHLVKYSSMFDRNVPYTLEWISMDSSINVDDFDICVEELLERNPKDLENEN